MRWLFGENWRKRKEKCMLRRSDYHLCASQMELSAAQQRTNNIFRLHCSQWNNKLQFHEFGTKDETRAVLQQPPFHINNKLMSSIRQFYLIFAQCLHCEGIEASWFVKIIRTELPLARTHFNSSDEKWQTIRDASHRQFAKLSIEMLVCQPKKILASRAKNELPHPPNARQGDMVSTQKWQTYRLEWAEINWRCRHPPSLNHWMDAKSDSTNSTYIIQNPVSIPKLPTLTMNIILLQICSP